MDVQPDPGVFRTIADALPSRATVWKVAGEELRLLYLNEPVRQATAIEALGPDVALRDIFPGRLTLEAELRLKRAMQAAVAERASAAFKDFEFQERHQYTQWYSVDLIYLEDDQVAILDMGNLMVAQRILAAIVTSSDDAIIGKTLDGTIIAWNLGAEAIYGYMAAEMIGRPIFTLVPPGGEAEVNRFHERIARGEKVIRHVTRRVRKDGGLIDVSVTISPIRDPEGAIIGASTVARDITAKTKLEAKVQQQENLERLGAMASGIAHDFNNLLVSIIGNADLLRGKLTKDKAAQRHIELITRTSIHASELCQQLLNFSGQKPSLTQAVDVSEIARDVAEVFESGLPRTTHLKMNLEQRLAMVSINVTELRQLIMNLLQNAAEAVQAVAGGLITISTRMQKGSELDMSSMPVSPVALSDNFVCVEVTDTGCGMAPAVQARMFDPYFTTKTSGHGLGLATALGVVRNHSGGYTVDSEVGRGTTLSIYFPTSTAALEEEDTVDWSGSKKLVLVVDDEESVRTTAREILEGAGFQVVCARHGRQGLDIFRRHADDIAVVLLDMTMPHMDGEETLRAMQRVRSDVRVVLSSGYAVKEALKNVERSSGVHFLPKPYRASALVYNIYRALHGG